MKASLSAALDRIDDLLPTRAPRAWASLAPPASVDALERLARSSLGGALPAELAAWFGWHDGQRGTSAIAPDSSYTLHSIESALAVHATLSAADADIQRPWDCSWLPLFENGAGDHLVYANGALIEYRDDDPRRPVRWASLVAWAKSTATQLAKVKPRKIPPPGCLAWIGAESLLGWQAGLRLDQSAVPAAELGALYRSEIAALAAQPAGIVLHYESGRSHLAVKLGADRWLVCFGVDLERTGQANAVPVPTALARHLSSRHSVRYASFGDPPAPSFAPTATSPPPCGAVPHQQLVTPGRSGMPWRERGRWSPAPPNWTKNTCLHKGRSRAHRTPAERIVRSTRSTKRRLTERLPTAANAASCVHDSPRTVRLVPTVFITSAPEAWGLLKKVSSHASSTSS
jgi:hypothetical protein